MLEWGDWPRNPPNTHTRAHTHTLGDDPWPNFHRDSRTPKSPGIAIIERMGRSKSVWALFSVSRIEERTWVEFYKHNFVVVVVIIVAFIVVGKRCL